MSLKKTNDNRGSYRGAGAYSKDYAKFDGWPGQKLGSADYPSRDIYDKVDGVGDYDGEFTGPIRAGDKNRWAPLADRQNTRGDGAYSRSGRSGRKNTERGRKADFGNIRGAKVSD